MEGNMNTFETLAKLNVHGKSFHIHSLKNLEKKGYEVSKLPISIRILLESVLRNENKTSINAEYISVFLKSAAERRGKEIPFVPARVLLQDFTGVPCVVDLAAMRSTVKRLGGNPKKINPLLPVDLVIDHSIQVDFFDSRDALENNTTLEFKRNKERYEFLRWGQESLEQFRVIPPASGICHQVNLEYLGTVVRTKEGADGISTAYFDSVIGTDSHTPMINGLGVLGWGVGGIEAEAAMLGQPVYMVFPPVVGVEINGSLKKSVTATDLVLYITQVLRKHGVVGKFVEFYGEGLAHMSVPDRATISNMAPEYGATMGFFPVDDNTLRYLTNTGRSDEQIELVRAYTQEQGVFRTASQETPEFDEFLKIDLAAVEPSIAGPKRPQDRIVLRDVAASWKKLLPMAVKDGGFGLAADAYDRSASIKDPNGENYTLSNGDVVIAAITSCTNTSNPKVLVTAGLLAKKAAERGLTRKPWVKTSFAPGSVVVTDYLERCDLLRSFEKTGFYLVGYGCTTCIGNSGPLPDHIAQAVEQEDLLVASVLSGNRNFEGRVNPHTKANFLMSPPLVLAYALAGNIRLDLTKDAIGVDTDGKPVYLSDLWPDDAEVDDYLGRAMDVQAFVNRYADIESANDAWNKIHAGGGDIYRWDSKSTYIQEPPFFDDFGTGIPKIEPINDARVLVHAGNSITTDHISPAGAIAEQSPAGHYLQSIGVGRIDFNSYGSRRGNDRIMTRGTFANIRFRNKLAEGTEGSQTVYFPTKEVKSIYDAAMLYKQAKIPTVVLAGKDYGMGSSRDWAAKGVFLLGVRAIIAESYERIHRSNLVGMGVLPLQFQDGDTAETLGLTGWETYTIAVDDSLKPQSIVQVRAEEEGQIKEFQVLCRIDSAVEIEYYRNQGILQTVMRTLVQT